MPQTVQERQSTEQVYDWLRAEAHRAGLDATIYTEAAKQENRFLIVPVYIAGDLDAFDFASSLQDLEDAWNSRKPKPDWLLILRPGAKPREVSTNGHV